jgi:Tol biopolymer transport system component
MVYLVHADNLIPTEVAEAKQESKKNESTYTIAGTASPARTPLAEPIFLIQSAKIQPDRLELYRLDVKSGHREVTTAQRRIRGGPRPLRLTVTRLDGGLYRIEASETLENGEYSLSPNDSNHVFCFEVY